jgi:protein-S-isoprenylcysteine O-methyltransferase Ste14
MSYEVKAKRALPPTYLLVAIILQLLLHFVVPVVKFIPSPWNLLGILPLAAGMVMNLVADGVFKKVETTVKPFQESSRLVTDGIYAYTRNPMYVGYVLMLAGLAILVRSLTPWLVIPVFAVLMDRVFIVAEERMLAEKFGDPWKTYSKRVRRWV